MLLKVGELVLQGSDHELIGTGLASGVDLTLGYNNAAGPGLRGEVPSVLWRICKGMFLPGRARREHPSTHTGGGACAGTGAEAWCLVGVAWGSLPGGPLGHLLAAGLCGVDPAIHWKTVCNWVLNP